MVYAMADIESAFPRLKRTTTRRDEGKPPHCTLAVTVAFPFNVKVHVFRLLPPLEHAPDQIASLPLLTARVMLVPMGMAPAWNCRLPR